MLWLHIESFIVTYQGLRSLIGRLFYFPILSSLSINRNLFNSLYGYDSPSSCCSRCYKYLAARNFTSTSHHTFIGELGRGRTCSHFLSLPADDSTTQKYPSMQSQEQHESLGRILSAQNLWLCAFSTSHSHMHKSTIVAIVNHHHQHKCIPSIEY